MMELKNVTCSNAFDFPEFPLTVEFQDEAKRQVEVEWQKAVAKFPKWPVSVYAAQVVIDEETGEAAKDELDFRFGGASLDALAKEHAQAAAMHIRAIQHILVIQDNERRNDKEQP